MSSSVRLIVYESNDHERMDNQLKKSLPDGEHNYGNMKVSIMTIGIGTLANLFIQFLKKEFGS